MPSTIKTFLTGITIGEPTTFENMTIHPLAPLGDDPSGDAPAPDVVYVTLGEAMQSGTVTVEELDGGGSVPEVKVTNTGDAPVVLVDGEEIVGAKQNRVVNTTLVAASKTEIVIPVSCIEAGRWHTRSHTFGHAGRIVPHDLRTRKTRSVGRALRDGRGYRSDQGEVWRNVDEVHETLGTASPTRSLSDAMERSAPRLDEYVAAFPQARGQTGCAVAVGGRAAGVELLADEQLYARLHRQILTSHAMRAMMSRRRGDATPATSSVEKLVARAAASKWTRYDAPGVGTQLRAQNKDLVGTAVVHEGRVVHLVVAAA